MSVQDAVRTVTVPRQAGPGDQDLRRSTTRRHDQGHAVDGWLVRRLLPAASQAPARRASRLMLVTP